MTPAEWRFARGDLEQVGFLGWTPADELTRNALPKGAQGVYIAYRQTAKAPTFLSVSSAGMRKGRDPTIPIPDLFDAWVPESQVVYIGKADLTATSDLQKRVWAFVRQGRGRNAGHWGGRATWQLTDGQKLLVAWMETKRNPREVESEFLAAFVAAFDRLPFANMIA